MSQPAGGGPRADATSMPTAGGESLSTSPGSAGVVDAAGRRRPTHVAEPPSIVAAALSWTEPASEPASWRARCTRSCAATCSIGASAAGGSASPVSPAGGCDPAPSSMSACGPGSSPSPEAGSSASRSFGSLTDLGGMVGRVLGAATMPRAGIDGTISKSVVERCRQAGAGAASSRGALPPFPAGCSGTAGGGGRSDPTSRLTAAFPAAAPSSWSPRPLAASAPARSATPGVRALAGGACSKMSGVSMNDGRGGNDIRRCLPIRALVRVGPTPTVGNRRELRPGCPKLGDLHPIERCPLASSTDTRNQHGRLTEAGLEAARRRVAGDVVAAHEARSG